MIAIFRSGHTLFAESLDAETVRETVIELAVVALVTLGVFVVIGRSRRSPASGASAKTALILSLLGLLSPAVFFLVGFIAVVLATGAAVLALESRGRAASGVGGQRLATAALAVAAISTALAVVLAFVASRVRLCRVSNNRRHLGAGSNNESLFAAGSGCRDRAGSRRRRAGLAGGGPAALYS